MPNEQESAANNYYAVKITQENIGKLRAAWRTVAFAVLLIMGLNGAEQPKLRVAVSVIERSTGKEMCSFSYNGTPRALAHADMLRERLEKLSKADFERDLGIG